MKKLFIIILFILTQKTIAQTWTGNTNTDWNTPTNWNPNAVPIISSNVIIPGIAIATNQPVLKTDVIINTINMQSGSKLDFKGKKLTITSSVTSYNYFTSCTLNNTDVASDIDLDINIGTVGYATYLNSITVNDNITITISGANTNIYYDGASTFNGNTTYKITANAGFSPANTYGPNTYNGNLSINRTTSGSNNYFNAGATINGNFSLIDNSGSYNYFPGNNPTTVNGKVDITCNYPSPNTFRLNNVKNTLTGGLISVQNSLGLDFQNNNLLVNSINISGYKGNAYAYFRNNTIVGNTSLADDVNFINGYASFIDNNTFTGTTNFTNKGTNELYEASLLANHYIGQTTFNGASTGNLRIGHGFPSIYDGDLYINRTAVGATYAFNGGGIINGNFNHSNLTSGNTYFGGSIQTKISGMLNIDANFTSLAEFTITNLKNTTTGGTIKLQNTKGFDINSDTLLVNSFSVTGYSGNSYGYLRNCKITGNTTIADDPTYSGGYATFIDNNTLIGTNIFTNNGTNELIEATSNGNHYIGNTTYNGAGLGNLRICNNFQSIFDGNLTISRTAAGNTYGFKSGATINGNLNYTNSTSGNTYFGNLSIKTKITGSLNLLVNNPTFADFVMYHLINETSGNINLQHTKGFDIQGDTLMANINITGYGGSAYGYFLKNKITGNFNVSDDNGYNGGYSTYLQNNQIMGNSSLTVNGSNQLFDANISNSANQYLGDLTLVKNGSGQLNIAQSTSIDEISGNLLLNSAAGINIGKLKFTGTSNSIIEQVNTQQITFIDLTIDKTSPAKVWMYDPITISNKLNLTNGNLCNTTNNILTINDNATITGGSNNSYIDGQLKKVGNDVFTFPIGSNGYIAPITISTPTNITDAFTAQYKALNPTIDGFNVSQKAATLNHVLAQEYWLLDGNSPIYVTLGWDAARSGQVNPLASTRVAHWNNTNNSWDDLGNSETTGNPNTGTVKTGATVSSFSPFAIASIEPFIPLPINLISFSGKSTEFGYELFWKTSNEVAFSHFEIERSENAKSFEKIGEVKAQGGPSEKAVYEYVDNFEFGISDLGLKYYRIKMVDLDGSFKHSKIITLENNHKTQLNIYPNPTTAYFKINTNEKIENLDIIDFSGNIIDNFIYSTDKQYDISFLPLGLYFVKMKIGDKVEVFKLLKK